MSEFADSFVATRYLLGVRGEALLIGLEAEAYAPALPLARALGHEDRQARARVLARPLGALLRAVEALQLKLPK